MRVFWFAFFGKLAAALFIAICYALGFGPNYWAAVVLGFDPTVVARVGFIALGTLVFGIFFAPIIYRHFAKRRTWKKLLALWATVFVSASVLGASTYLLVKEYQTQKETGAKRKKPIAANGETPTNQSQLERLSNKDLSAATIRFAGSLRDYEVKQRSTEPLFRPAQYPPNATEDEKNRIWHEHNDRDYARSLERQAQFRTNYLSSAQFLRDELQSRLKERPIIFKPPDYLVAFEGRLSGPTPISDMADYLEYLARLLPEQ